MSAAWGGHCHMQLCGNCWLAVGLHPSKADGRLLICGHGARPQPDGDLKRRGALGTRGREELHPAQAL